MRQIVGSMAIVGGSMAGMAIVVVFVLVVGKTPLY